MKKQSAQLERRTMVAALHAIQNDKMSRSSASAAYGILEATLSLFGCEY
jgi:hypothetical protein